MMLLRLQSDTSVTFVISFTMKLIALKNHLAWDEKEREKSERRKQLMINSRNVCCLKNAIFVLFIVIFDTKTSQI